MVLDFDVKIFCQNLKATKPPYECPVKDCGKIYKSYCGIQFHLYNFDHENPENNAPSPAKKPGKKKKGWHHRQMRRSPTPPEFLRPNQKTLSYAESQRLVEIDLGGQLHRINIYEPLEIISQDEIDNHHNTEKEEKAEKTPIKAKVTDVTKGRKEPNTPAHNAQTKLPEAMFKVVEDYIKPSHMKEKQNSYYRYIEKSTDQLDDEVEYDMDEEVGVFTSCKVLCQVCVIRGYKLIKSTTTLNRYYILINVLAYDENYFLNVMDQPYG